VVLTLGKAATGAPNDFAPTVNLADVGGTPTDVAFVRTDAGIRIAALVPSKSSAVLVDPQTSTTLNVSLPQGYSRMSLVTAQAGGSSSADVALLYGPGSGASSVAFWSLGRALGEPYRSIEALPLASNISALTDVPAPNDGLKILTAQGAFYVLDLRARTASPLVTSGEARLFVSPSGERVWAFQNAGTSVAAVALADLHPTPLDLTRPVQSVFEVERKGGGRSLVAIHGAGTIGATVLDATRPELAKAHAYAGLLLEDLP
jgi:hypothetical protein